MIEFLKKFTVPVLTITLLATGCANSPKIQNPNNRQDTTKVETSQQNTNANGITAKPGLNTVSPQPSIDITKVKPNEAGKIMVVMFHNFVESFTPTKYDDGQYTTTFNDFRNLLQTLYDKGYRLINLNDYLNNNITVPAGYIPMVFTFDDATAGQFNLVDDNGRLVANKNSAVGIMEEFNKAHPDFGLKGTFYVNLGLDTFDGKGTVPERLKYLIDEGFEIGNHTKTHAHLPDIKSADKLEEEIGGNQNLMDGLVPGYKFTSFALPFGQASKSLQGYVAKGEFQGKSYENIAVMLVGANPAVSPVSKNFNPLSTPRVRATGMKQVDCDLAWWLKNISRNDQYISDGNPNTITVPKSKEAGIDKDKLRGKTLTTY